ncbi:acyl-CoA N-acyltransferase [Hygrophoropsis aurantiaca]|uniref:Acyl-CoA N-acyltransferase n=1 Tax=Hygrophoropsis aurantiaca TaxID=72124 RepID=A0ACB8AVC9_9AGAM|nr:acyl-CoA N-acyltransferase [Hygrophoropsis aurantiaca]
MSFQFRPPQESDLPALAEIFNNEIETSTCTFRTDHVDLSNRRAWLEDIRRDNYPCLVIVHTIDVDDLSSIVGWCNLSRYRPQEAYSTTTEITLYIHRDFRGLGLGSQVIGCIVTEARERGYQTILAMVATENAPNTKFWVKCGFEQRGILKDVGKKFGRWLDVGVYQLMLSSY